MLWTTMGELMLVSEGIAHCLMIDYEEMLVGNLPKQQIVKKLANTWLLTLPEVVQIIKEKEAGTTADELGEIV